MTEENDLLRFIARTVNSLAGECQVSAEGARALATKLVTAIRGHFGGQRAYVRTPSREPRNSEILALHDAGESRIGIAKRFGIHPTTVDRIIAAHRLPPPRPSQGDGLGPRNWNL